MTDQDTNQADSTTPQWKPLSPRARRIVGVLVEKAKTTPDAYPMSLNALVNGCNQKSNRQPQMSLDSDDVEDELEALCAAGAVTELQGGGRVSKYRHHMYEWLGVDKFEIAVVTELLLRGEQTLGDLRARAARMEPIPSQDALRPVLRSLKEKKLLIELTPPGRGQLVTHGLLTDRELVEMERRFGALPTADATEAPTAEAAPSSAPTPAPPPSAPAVQPPAPATATASDAGLKLLQEEVEMQRAEIDDLKAQISELQTQVSDLTDKMDALLS